MAQERADVDDPEASLTGHDAKGRKHGKDTRVVAPVPRLALTCEEAAAAIGIGLTSFKKYVQPELRIVRRGSLRLVPTAEIDEWLAPNKERVVE